MFASLVLILAPLAVGGALPGRFGAATRWYLGLVALAALTVVTHGLHAPQALSLGLTALAVAAALALGRKHWQLPGRDEWPKLGALALVLAVPFAAVWLQAVDQPVNAWDALHIWFFKTRSLAAWWPLSQLMPDPHYPDLGAAYWMLMLKLGAPESVGRAVFVVVHFSLLAALLDVSGRPYRWSTVIAIAATFLLWLDGDACSNGYQDSTVAATVGIAAVILARQLAGETTRLELLAAGALAGAAGLVKNEGTFLGLVTTASFAGVWLLLPPAGWRTRARALVPLFAAQGAVVVIWPLLSLLNGLDPSSVQGNAFSLKSAFGAWRSFDRWPAIQVYFDAHLARLHLLVLVGAVTTVGALALAPRARKPLVFLWAAWSLHLGFVLWVFFSTKQDLAWHLQTAFARLASQGVPLLGIAVVVALAALMELLLQFAPS
jgi:hypothetical protein